MTSKHDFDLYEHAPEAVFLADLEGRYTALNPAACRLLGYEQEELLGTSMGELIVGEDLERLRQTREDLSEGLAVIGEWRLRKKNGEILFVELSATILPDGSWLGFVRDVSERKHLERELRKAEEIAAAILSISADAIISIDEDQRVTRFNHGAEKIFGYTSAEMVGAPLERLIPERFRQRHREHVERFAASDATARRMGERDTEIFGRRKSGEEFPADAAISKLEIDGQRVLRVALRDITEQKHKERALRLAEAKASGILAISADAIISIDSNQRITAFNDGAEHIFGYAKTEVIGSLLDVLIPERFRARHREHVERFAHGDVAARRMGERGLEIVGLRKNGEEFPADAAISKLDVAGERILTVALRDVTEEQRVAREQRFLAEAGAALVSTLEYEDMLTTVARLAVRDLADYCIVDIVEPDGAIRRLKVVSRDPSRAWVGELLQHVSLDRSGSHLVRGALATRRTDLIQDLTPKTLEGYAQNPKHLRALLAANPRSVLVVPLVARGALVGVIALLSETARYGPADVRLAEDLADRAALSIDNARLYRQARGATQLRDDVLAIVAHDLRNPLGTVGLQAELLREHGDEAVRRAASRLARSADRMNRLIEDLLDVARIEAGALFIEPARIGVRDILHEAASVQRPSAMSAGIDLRVEGGSGVPDVLADHHRLLQVFENLVGNALKFTPRGGSVTIGAAASDGAVLFWITDTGEGIAPEVQAHLFERFYQLRKSDRRGAGLGLPIAKGVVEAHRGTIWVDSAPGRGSTFFFTIPTAPESARSAAAPP